MTMPRSPTRSQWRGRVLLAITVASLCIGCRRAPNAVHERVDESAPPVRGGTLRIVTSSDVDHLSTVSGTTAMAYAMSQALARQLVTYRPVGDFETLTELVPDLSRELPTQANGGISADGLVYRFHLRTGVLWNTTPPRVVTTRDVVRAFQMLCNPVSPVGVPGYYTSTIVGMAEYCAAFARVSGRIGDTRRFVTSHDIAGVRALDDQTIQFRLLTPASDFLNLVSMPFTSPVPEEYLDYLPDSPEFRQHTLSNGPYAITRYVQDRRYELERNPVWDAQYDPNRPAYVDRISVMMGTDAELNQLQIEAGTSDLSFDAMLAAHLASGLANGDRRFRVLPDGDHYDTMNYLALNLVGPGDGGALRQLKVRQALAVAVDKQSLVQLSGGAGLARPLRQAVLSTAAGFVPGADQYVTAGDRGNPVLARALLAEAGFPNGLRLHLASSHPVRHLAQSIQASLLRAGISTELRLYTVGDFYGTLLRDRHNAERGLWDLALVNWYPDWFGRNNGRSIVVPLFDGRRPDPSPINYGGFDSPAADATIDRALAAPNVERANVAWAEAAARVMADVAIVPLIELKFGYMLSSRVRGCFWSVLGYECNLTAVWLADGASARRP